MLQSTGVRSLNLILRSESRVIKLDMGCNRSKESAIAPGPVKAVQPLAALGWWRRAVVKDIHGGGDGGV